MTRRPVIYDVTRLVTRALNPAPNGIDRLDFALAGHFLKRGEEQNQALITTLLGQRLASSAQAAQTIDEIEAYWREDDDASRDDALAEVVARLEGPRERSPRTPIRREPDFALLAQNWRALRRWPFRLGPSPRQAPPGAIFFNAGTFLLEKDWHLRWLEARPDVAAVFYVHDLLAFDYPEFFWPGEAEAQDARLRNVCRYGSGIVTGSQAVARRFAQYAAMRGRPDIKICVARPPVSPAFSTPASPPQTLASTSYFVVCGTIEPRKNHLMLLNVWRELAQRADAPKLVIVGKRGWLNDNVLRLLGESPALRGLVIEAGGLSTPGLRRLLAGARALLAPSFAEGFGLPVAEAMAAEVPIVASNIEVFREVGGDALDYVDPLDGRGWLAVIEHYSQPHSPRREAALARLREARRLSRPDFFAAVDAFLADLAPMRSR